MIPYAMSHKISILSTMPIAQSLIDGAAEQGALVDALSFIKVSAVTGEKIENEIVDLCHLHVTVVFTSANAVKAVDDIVLHADPEWDIYCIGNATLDAVNKCFRSSEVRGTAKDAASLAALIIEHGADEVVLFCGDKRLDTLPVALREEDIPVYEVVVYTTTGISQKLKRAYDGILFFSPSAVGSFFGANKVSEDTVFFAIGTTTADAIKKHTCNKVIVSETASKETVLNYAVEYFQKQARPDNL